MNRRRKWLSTVFFILGFLCIAPKSNSFVFNKITHNTQSKTVWVDSLVSNMTLDDKICQLMMIRAHSDKGPAYEADVANLIKKYKVGGLCFFQGTPVKQATLTNNYQDMSEVPLMIAMDAEWGLGMRLTDSVISYPKQMTLGAIKDEALVKEMGKEIAIQLKRMGVHVNFAPVADINNNADNPVINVRSFGENRENVAVKATAYMKGLQDNGIIACAKHFPGHGDTKVDSHLDLPIINKPMTTLDTLELFPFNTLINQGLKSIMVGHLSVPAIDDKNNKPTSLSSKAINELLVKKLGFKGLIFTDGMEMNAISKTYKAGEAEAEALWAGNDILLLPKSVPLALQGIKDYIQQGKISVAEIDHKLRKVLEAKYNLGLSNYKPIELFNLVEDLNTPSQLAFKRTLVENALTLLRNQSNKLPLKNLSNTKIVSIAMGTKKAQLFQNTIRKYISGEFFGFDENDGANKKYQILLHCKKKDYVIVSLHNLNNNSKNNYGISDNELDLINDISKVSTVILVNFGSPYLLKYFDNIPVVIQAYEDADDFQDLAAQLIFGGATCKGKLPVTSSFKSRYGLGLSIFKPTRLGYDLPERVGMSSAKLNAIDLLARDAINIRATPGCQVLVAKDGKIIFDKSFGYQTYQKKIPITTGSIYDLASITKVAATTLSVMKLQELGKMSINDDLVKYLPELECTNKEYLLIKDVMTHHAGLRAWIPFYEETLLKVHNRSFPSPKIYSPVRRGLFTVKVIDSLYMNRKYKDVIWDEIIKSDLPNKGQYKYSDLGFYMLAEIINRISGKSINQFVNNNFYNPLGLQTMTFLPLNKFKKNHIVPTEIDNYFRMKKVQGYVHDMGAAMMGGVSGHAGLFSNSLDLAVILQMLLNDGTYGGKQFLNPETVRLFTSRCPGCKRRAIGFDMSLLDKKAVSNTSKLSSEANFGHTGFTGTCMWADPENNLVYIFLSNRTYPTMQNRRLIREDYRERIQTAIYESIIL